jgi:hypothetical protein
LNRALTAVDSDDYNVHRLTLKAALAHGMAQFPDLESEADSSDAAHSLMASIHARLDLHVQ